MADKSKTRVSMMVPVGSTVKSLMGIGASQANIKSMSRMRMRRHTFGFGGVPGVKPLKSTSNIGFEFKRPPLLFLNTYQLDSTKPFKVEDVTKVTEEMLDELFTGHIYNVQESPSLALRVSGELMRKVKALEYNRYRIFTIVTIGQKRAQSYNNAIAFLWDHERDAYVNVQREVSSAFIQVTVFGVYLD